MSRFYNPSLIIGLIILLGGGIFIGYRLSGHPGRQGSGAAATTSAVENVAVTNAGTSQQAPAAHASAAAPAVPAFSVTAIPIGDGHVSTEPKVGYVYSCQTSFGGGGAGHAGDWITGDTWNLDTKVSVEGQNYWWGTAAFSATVSGGELILSGNGLPVGEPTGDFPISPSDPAYAYDRNPNKVTAYTVSYTLPADPTFAAKASCLPLGAIGYALDGVAIFDALDDAGRDAGAHEIQDSCAGHPQSAGIYHYHTPSPCMPHANENNAVVGYALDGFPITSVYDANHQFYVNSELDSCHGTTSAIVLPDGTTKTMYHYVMTEEYPYTLGCFRGTPVSTRAAGQAAGNQAGGGTTPPPAAIAACSGQSAGSSCSFTGAGGNTVSGSCATPQGTLACVPNK